MKISAVKHMSICKLWKIIERKKELSFCTEWSMIDIITGMGVDIMICSVHTLGINGIQGSHVVVECYISNGLPGFDIVGLPDAAVKEYTEEGKYYLSVCIQNK